MDDELILLNPGPAGTSKRVRDALLRGDMCHREPEFTSLLNRIRENLPHGLGLGDTHESIVVTGSGTAAMEMAVIGSVRAGRSALMVNNGVYGERMVKVAAAHGISVHEVAGSWNQPIDPEAVCAELAAHDDVDAVVCVQHETTTGLMNPVAELGALVAKTAAVFVVDATSSLAIEDPQPAGISADIICGSASKGLHGFPGVAFLLCSAKGLARIEAAPPRSVYLSPAAYLAPQRKGEVPFTPAVQILYALDEALAELAETGGPSARIQLYRERAALVRAQFTRVGLSTLVDERHRSNSVTLLRLPLGVSYKALHAQLRHRGYVSYAAQGKLAADFFRICTLGEIPWHRLEELEDALAASISAAR
ncbi:2-aminoethylphosphonate-pyruvate transaminase [Kibdelosporangium banguiense]|uniref:2-aminoethylphosphonate-pyruvate transaminase n=1 Tax=Kibdelosporangium banguiense TaxID=1365924 RepID=A0ABS4TH21_9PSEU|nr:aminotransferase class V-fold PLP-dependent enzyme [Kibdelosporangium banguiense]MBP2323126.1 2-aminoethylphosphonate-pyruvate transaminase [Kibdelosporangium banguiense]